MGVVNCNFVLAVLAACLGSGFQHGYHTGVINVPQKILMSWVGSSMKSKYGNEPSSRELKVVWGVTTSIMNIGGTIGGLMSGAVAKTFGPKTGLVLNNIFVAFATILLYLSKTVNSFEIMIVGRLLIGVNCGLNAGLCPMYLSEIAPIKLRGATGSIYQLVITISILVAQIVGLDSVFGTADLWPYLFLVPVAFAVFQVVVLPFCAESPNHLLATNEDPAKAKKALQWLRKSEDVQSEIGDLIAGDAAVKALPKVSIGSMFTTSSLRTPLLIAVSLMVAQQLSGINAVIFYSTEIFHSAGLKGDAPQYATLGIGIINVLMTVVSVVLVEIAGRKTLLLVGFAGMAVVTMLLSIALKFTTSSTFIPYLCIILLFTYIILFASGAGSIPWFLVTEIFNQAARPTAVSIAVPTNWIGNFLVTLTFPPIEDLIGPFVFWIFVICNGLYVIFIIKVIPETKNKTIEEITSSFK